MANGLGVSGRMMSWPLRGLRLVLRYFVMPRMEFLEARVRRVWSPATGELRFTGSRNSSRLGRWAPQSANWWAMLRPLRWVKPQLLWSTSWNWIALRKMEWRCCMAIANLECCSFTHRMVLTEPDIFDCDTLFFGSESDLEIGWPDIWRARTWWQIFSPSRLWPVDNGSSSMTSLGWPMFPPKVVMFFQVALQPR